MFSVLIGDPCEHARASSMQALSLLPCRIDTVENGMSVMDHLRTRETEIAIIDPFAVEFGGVEILREMCDCSCKTNVIVLTEHASIRNAANSFKYGAREFLQKPVAPNILVEAIDEILSLRPSPSYWARRLERFIRDHLTVPTLSLRTLSEHFGISESYASKLFQKEIRVPFKRHLASSRVQEVKRQLRTGDDPIYLIADRCGFSSQSRLSESFTRIEGITPSAYRRQSRG